MKNKILKVIIALFLLAAMSQGTFASYPSYNTETDCRTCHGITADRHHLLVANGTHQCTDCHAMKYDTTTQSYYPEIIRNCLTCHAGKDHTDVHHLLVARGLFVCSDCHPMKYDAPNNTYYPEITWDCTVCHSTVLSPGSPVPVPPPIPSNSPAVTNFSPESPINDILEASRKFNVTINQTANISWYINGNRVQSDDTVMGASYNNTSAAEGVWNVSAIATNANGSVMRSWTWNVTLIHPPPTITSSAPISPINDTVGYSRKFGITIDQTANISWYINGNRVQSDDTVMGASYNNTSATQGVWNVSAIATNANGSLMRSWTWSVSQVVPSITITSPNGGENWRRGTTHEIKWTNVGNPGIKVKTEIRKGTTITNVKIELLKGTTVVSTLAKNAPNSGSYSWKISRSQSTATNYKIRITRRGTTPLYTDSSDNYFQISN